MAACQSKVHSKDATDGELTTECRVPLTRDDFDKSKLYLHAGGEVPGKCQVKSKKVEECIHTSNNGEIQLEHYKSVPQGSSWMKLRTVSIQKDYNANQTQGLLMAYRDDDNKVKLSLQGPYPNDSCCCFTQYIHNYEIGEINYSLLLFESEKFPGHYVGWHDDTWLVDCEPGNPDINDRHFHWIMKRSHDHFEMLQAKVKSINDEPKYYLLIAGSKPVILPQHGNTFLISGCG